MIPPLLPKGNICYGGFRGTKSVDLLDAHQLFDSLTAPARSIKDVKYAEVFYVPIKLPNMKNFGSRLPLAWKVVIRQSWSWQVTAKLVLVQLWHRLIWNTTIPQFIFRECTDPGRYLFWNWLFTALPLCKCGHMMLGLIDSACKPFMLVVAFWLSWLGQSRGLPGVGCWFDPWSANDRGTHETQIHGFSPEYGNQNSR